jgi:hypothetical protein
VAQFAVFKATFAVATNTFGTIQTNYAAASEDRRSAIRQKAIDLGLINAPVTDGQFIKVLRRAVDAGDPVATQKFKTLAEFSSQVP